MNNYDRQYVTQAYEAGFLRSPCLELGVGVENLNNKSFIANQGIAYFGTDLALGSCVDYIADFEDSLDSLKLIFSDVYPFETVVALNVLEHTFNPIQVLDNIIGLLLPGGTCILTTPVVWPLHSFPHDCWRINPDFYEEYCKRRSLRIVQDKFEYLGVCKVKESIDDDGEYSLPKPQRNNRVDTIYSRLIHRIFNTYGRGMFFSSFIQIGVIIQKPS